MTEHEPITLTFTPLQSRRGEPPPEVRLRQLLKVALRGFRFRASWPTPASPPAQAASDPKPAKPTRGAKVQQFAGDWSHDIDIENANEGLLERRHEMNARLNRLDAIRKALNHDPKTPLEFRGLNVDELNQAMTEILQPTSY
jgi:hypothetical protein